MRLLSFFAKRFVAGETVEQGIHAARAVNARGMGSILDYLGEDVHSSTEAAAAAEEYAALLDAIASATVDSAVSLKASQMGLLISKDVCRANISRVAEQAAKSQRFVWMDMEGSGLTQGTVDVFDELAGKFSNLGLCLQAYLKRTKADVEKLARRPVTIRLCKGAYKESSDVAFTDRREVEASFRELSKDLLKRTSQGVYPAFATHDPAMIDFVVKTAQEGEVGKESFEFQMLYGIRNGLLEDLAKKGFRTRVYIPYGTTWLPYFLRRLRERKENVYFLMRNLFRL